MIPLFINQSVCQSDHGDPKNAGRSSARANEEIYNKATEKTKFTYVCPYAGPIPARPGKSHQSLRDLSLFGALANCVILEPANGLETKRALEWCVDEPNGICMMWLARGDVTVALSGEGGDEVFAGYVRYL